MFKNMKKNLLISSKLTIVLIIILAGLFPLLISGIGKLTPGKGKGVTLSVRAKWLDMKSSASILRIQNIFGAVRPLLTITPRDLPVRIKGRPIRNTCP